ncbi:hypothetical protein ABTK61_19505, partial [Acinetobacter baumannii]
IDWTQDGEIGSSGGQLNSQVKPGGSPGRGAFMTNPGMDCHLSHRQKSAGVTFQRYAALARR